MKSGFATKQYAATVAMAVLLALPGRGKAADLSLPVTGNLLGSVVDATGTPQMGATVQLFNKYERLIAKSLTTPDGRFAFAGLPVDLYSIRVSLASFLPVSRQSIAIKAGLDSVLQVHLATLFSNIELSYTVPTGAMTEDWKWVLRSSPATRPITRYLPVETAKSSGAEFHPRIFSGTHAMLSVSGADGGLIDFDSAQGDLGTGFALSTNVMGKNQIQVGGSFGQNASFGPSGMALCAIYSRRQDGGFGEPPEVTLTMAQLGRAGPQFPGGQTVLGSAPGESGPVLRAMSLSVYEVADPVDAVHLEYGMIGESVDYLQHTSRVSPFARMSVDLEAIGEIIAAYSDGGRPDELTAHQQVQTAELENQPEDLINTVSTLARLPQLSERNGNLELQRIQNYELGYRKVAGSRTYAASAFYEIVSNGRMNVAGDLSGLDAADLFSDGISKTSTYDIGRYERKGYLTSARQRVNDSLDLTLAYGRMGGFSPGAGKFLDQSDHNLANASVHFHAPRAGTQIYANYGWMDDHAVIPRHVFTTQNASMAPGLNIIIRQPLPSLFGMPGRLELTADLRNLLAQGYIPVNTGDGHTLLIVQAPRAIRGGVNFIF